ncbi:hypothetical protein GLOIN_2v1594327 [Rhizophagus clarus]|uniref:Protein kinase domain-containing protein n=1 Tax=Rhizophagus clarus TaxID=94130 RepID=A0A8H3M3D5_9GLOM|nr:hypothetical protein GLOIN_2v1594327 [Rhizophagus clarus]
MKIVREKAIFFQYDHSKVIPIVNSAWIDFTELFERLQKLFVLTDTMANYDFIIANKKVTLNSKVDFIRFTDENQNSSKNPVIVLDIKGSRMTYTYYLHHQNLENLINGILITVIKLISRSSPPSASSTVPATLYFLLEMAKFYLAEDDRRDEANKLLSQYLNRKVEPIVLGGNRNTDGTVYTIDLYREMNIEYRNSTKSCAHLENCGYYLTFCKKQGDTNNNYHVSWSLLQGQPLLTYEVRINSQYGIYLLWEASLQEKGKIQELLVNNEWDTPRMEISRAVEILHNNNFVHGGLREGNILVCRKVIGNFDMKQIDFEWSRSVETARITNFHITGFTAHFYTVKGKKDRDKLASPFYLPTILSSAFVSFCNITYINEWGVFLKYSF